MTITITFNCPGTTEWLPVVKNMKCRRFNLRNYEFTGASLKQWLSEKAGIPRDHFSLTASSPNLDRISFRSIDPYDSIADYLQQKSDASNKYQDLKLLATVIRCSNPSHCPHYVY